MHLNCWFPTGQRHTRWGRHHLAWWISIPNPILRPVSARRLIAGCWFSCLTMVNRKSNWQTGTLLRGIGCDFVGLVTNEAKHLVGCYWISGAWQEDAITSDSSEFRSNLIISRLPTFYCFFSNIVLFEATFSPIYSWNSFYGIHCFSAVGTQHTNAKHVGGLRYTLLA